MEMKQQELGESETAPPAGEEKKKKQQQQQEKKKKLTSYQVESLERSFQEDIKLEPERKMKLSEELGLEPRQIAIWFQNRRARWKVKQLKQENQKLQDEVMNLKAVVRDQASRSTTQISAAAAGYAEICGCGEETAESTSRMIHIQQHNNNIADQGKYCYTNVQEQQDYYNTVPMLPYCAGFPNYYP
ncbi:hypothetical protein RIF29_32796 [Crotalaria pallida]|uniref:Homeobox-leucine zipper protein n=1 Tax=Crotalaria pallida TaxID=3830 RepID=A0AAN9I2M6_CROPI